MAAGSAQGLVPLRLGDLLERRPQDPPGGVVDAPEAVHQGQVTPAAGPLDEGEESPPVAAPELPQVAGGGEAPHVDVEGARLEEVGRSAGGAKTVSWIRTTTPRWRSGSSSWARYSTRLLPRRTPRPPSVPAPARPPARSLPSERRCLPRAARSAWPTSPSSTPRPPLPDGRSSVASSPTARRAPAGSARALDARRGAPAPRPARPNHRAGSARAPGGAGAAVGLPAGAACPPRAGSWSGAGGSDAHAGTGPLGRRIPTSPL